jgi:hypothetical protein
MDHLHQHIERAQHSRIHMPRFDIRALPSRTAAVQRSVVELAARATCTDEDAPECRKPTQIPKLPIILGVV